MPNHLPLQSCSQSRDLSSHQDSLAPSWTGYARPSPENNNRKYMQISNSTQHNTRHKSTALQIYNNYSINLSITFLHIETAGYNNCKRKSIKLQLTLHKQITWIISSYDRSSTPDFLRRNYESAPRILSSEGP